MGCTCRSHVGSNSSTGNCCTCVLCSSPQDHSSSSVVCRSSCDQGSCPCNQSSSHCHCCSSVLCSCSREHGSSCVLWHRSSCVVRGCSCVIRILWCPSVRRACNQLCALIREGTVMSCLGCFGVR